MKKSKSTAKTRKSRIETPEQAKDFILGKMTKVLNDCLNQDIDDGFACEIIFFLTGQILLSKGETPAFEHTVSQLIENNQERFDVCECDIDEGDDGTFH